MKRCRTCVIPDSRPDTFFDETGQCAACIAHERRPTIDWREREEQLFELLTRARAVAKARGNAYDCIVPSSGGKDSTYLVLTLLEFGMRPLAVTAGTCHLTALGRQNLDNLTRYATTIEVNPKKSVRATLNRLGLTLVGDISWGEHVSIFTVPARIAGQLGIPFLFYGENPQNQYGGPLEAQDARQMTRRWVSEYGGFLGLRPADLIGKEGLSAEDLADYMPREGAPEDLEAHFLGQYLPWDSHRNAEVAVKAGMRTGLPCVANWWEHENLDNAQTGLHDHGMYRKYGYGRLAAQISVDVRAGKVTRDFALEQVHQRDGRFPFVYGGVLVRTVLERIGMTPEELWPVLDKFTNRELFGPTVDGRPVLKEAA